ncbi:hypothetical protein GGX14DRAFT_568898 [Mycena pura]|uniref:Uncharacterized protein n=1 Tax=Mycena pura TaxID=153505 RepID=A0AAD6VC76_9AGAR|nr:hypothetical protein GGX14DRAFT_568898 [Mycena pura]
MRPPSHRAKNAPAAYRYLPQASAARRPLDSFVAPTRPTVHAVPVRINCRRILPNAQRPRDAAHSRVATFGRRPASASRSSQTATHVCLRHVARCPSYRACVPASVAQDPPPPAAGHLWSLCPCPRGPRHSADRARRLPGARTVREPARFAQDLKTCPRCTLLRDPSSGVDTTLFNCDTRVLYATHQCLMRHPVPTCDTSQRDTSTVMRHDSGVATRHRVAPLACPGPCGGPAYSAGGGASDEGVQWCSGCGCGEDGTDVGRRDDCARGRAGAGDGASVGAVLVPGYAAGAVRGDPVLATTAGAPRHAASRPSPRAARRQARTRATQGRRHVDVEAHARDLLAALREERAQT